MTRPVITDADLERVIQVVVRKLEFRMKEKGRGAFVSSHEIMGIVSEEYDEMKEAVQENDHNKLFDELADIAVASLKGMASMQVAKLDW